MGLARPDQAIGKVLRVHTSLSQVFPVQVVGVAPDFAIDLTHGPVNPTFYSVDANCLTNLTVKIAPGAVAETLPAIGRLWKQLGPPRPIRETFVDDYMRRVIYAGSIRQGTALLVLAGVAVLVGVLGLFALAAFTAERRTKEIGVRKALGASTADILRLLLWQFTRPVLVANLIAWPLGWWALDRWLQGFAQRISLSPALFLLAGGAAVAIAAVTVSGHALRVASAKPVGALRYE
jgi:putative ABC transport system permease protein